MKNQYDENLILDVIEAIETLGVDGFHSGYNDKELGKNREELKESIDKIIICLERIDKEYTPAKYIKAKGERASELKGLVDLKEDMDMPLGCVIVAIIYNRDRFKYLRVAGWKDIIFFAPLHIIREMELNN